MLTFAICDDNKAVLTKLEDMLEKIFLKHNYEAQIVYLSDNTNDMLDYTDNNKVDVVILDINFKSSKDGLELAEKIRESNKETYIIFTTGHLEFAMVAYKFKTFDYIAKPFTFDRLEETIVRLFDDINGIPKKYIKIDSKKTLVDASEILYIKRDGMKLIFHTSKRDYETYSSFNKFQDKLPDCFKRCHKSYVVNICQAIYVDPISCTITFKDSSCCYIGPKYKSEILEVLANYGKS